MAEAIFQDMASTRLGCTVGELREHKIDVFSAGVAASDSMPASRDAVLVLKDRGIELSQHLSQQVTEPMLIQSDVVFAMTPDHLSILQNARPDLASRMRTLRPDGNGISDPIGGGIDEYRHCAQEISDCLEVILGDLIEKDTEAP